MIQLILSILILSINVFAGHPLHDPVVSNLRKRFIKATIPSPVDVPVNQNIPCVIFDSKPHNYRVKEVKNHLRFRNISGIYLNDGSNPVRSYALMTGGLHGVYKEGDHSYLSTYRITDSGEFIGEWAGIPRDNIKGRPPSVIHPDYFAVSYIICRPTVQEKI